MKIPNRIRTVLCTLVLSSLGDRKYIKLKNKRYQVMNSYTRTYTSDKSSYIRNNF